MKEEIKIPAMGESITEATIGSILQPTGSVVQESDEIIELETEKVNQVLYAPVSGGLNWSVKEGDTVTVGMVIGYVDTDVAQPEKKEEKAEEKPPSPPPGPKREKEEIKEEKKGEELRGKGVRVMGQEFLSELKEKPEPKPKPSELSKPTPSKAEPTPTLGNGRETRKRMTKIRKTIASRLVDALHNAAMLTTFNEVDMSAIIELRNKYKESFVEKHGVKLGFMSFFVKAIVEGLKEFPDFNAYIEGEDIVHREYYDVGIAVGTERGLFVPVIRDCEQLSYAQIEQEIVNYSKKARDGKLSIGDLKGGGFTITNGGVYGSLLSTPILNPPQAGILGMHKIMKRPIVVDDQIVIRPMMYLALSYDHRVVDGREAVSFLVRIKEILEDPTRLIFDGKV